MPTAVVYAHPCGQSFNHGILQHVKTLLEGKGEACRPADLYD